MRIVGHTVIRVDTYLVGIPYDEMCVRNIRAMFTYAKRRFRLHASADTTHLWDRNSRERHLLIPIEVMNL